MAEAAHKYPQKRNEDGGKYYVTVGGRHGLELGNDSCMKETNTGMHASI